MYYQELLEDFAVMCREIIGKEKIGKETIGKEIIGKKTIEKGAAGRKSPLTGVYLHGSMAMGCFNPKKSDIDLIVVAEGEISDAQKMKFMERVVQLNERAPAKGLELSVVKREYCRPFVYPTPYELHFSPAHLRWFRERPEDYIRNMKGEDRDLAAHFTIINRYGIALHGEAVCDVFGEVPKGDYADSIWFDVKDAAEDIGGNAVYVILNLCRAAAFLREGLCLSKAGGGEWGLKNISGKYRELIQGALDSYGGVRGEMQADRELARQFAQDMLGEIREHLVPPSMNAPQRQQLGNIS